MAARRRSSRRCRAAPAPPIRWSRRCCGARSTRLNPGAMPSTPSSTRRRAPALRCERAGAKGYVNALLRNFLRARPAHRGPARLPTRSRSYQHPRWWIERVRAAYPAAVGSRCWPRATCIRRCACASIARRIDDRGLRRAPCRGGDRRRAASARCASAARKAGAGRSPARIRRRRGIGAGRGRAARGRLAGSAGRAAGARCLRRARRQERAYPGDRRCRAHRARHRRRALRRRDAQPGAARAGGRGARRRLQPAGRLVGRRRRSTASWPTCPAPLRASRGGIRTSSGCGGATDIDGVRSSGRRAFWMRFGARSPRVVNCCMSPVRYFRRRTTR